MASVRGASSSPWDHRSAASDTPSLQSPTINERDSLRTESLLYGYKEEAEDPRVLFGGSVLETRLGSDEEFHHVAADTLSTFGSQLLSPPIESLPCNRTRRDGNTFSLATEHTIQSEDTTRAISSRFGLFGDPAGDSFRNNDSHSEQDDGGEPAQFSRPTLAITSQPTLLPYSETIALPVDDGGKDSMAWPWEMTSMRGGRNGSSSRSSKMIHTTTEDDDKMDEATAQTSVSLHKEDDDTIDSGTVGSPQGVHPVEPSQQVPLSLHVRVPSTSSTAASTVAEEVSYQQQQQQQQHHQRAPSWDSFSLEQLQGSFQNMSSSSALAASHHQAWQQVERPFYRNETMMQNVPTDDRWHQQNSYQHQQQQRLGGGQQQQHAFMGPRMPPTHPSADARLRAGQQQQQHHHHHSMPSPFSPPLMPQQQRRPSGNASVADRYGTQSQLPPATPPRQPTHSLHHTHVHSHHAARPSHRTSQTPASPHQPSTPLASGGGSRSASEVLKTLLRKKACLYEPDTSRSVALVTWLVGRELALEYGFFSRQQLQAGVHACVASKIDSGTITRTKVNRCMQIILNSCFHYIIPRPDGTEEDGSGFCRVFAQESSDNDAALLEVLPEPWKNISVHREEVLRAISDLEDGDSHARTVTSNTPTRPHQQSQGMVTPQQSPRICSQTPDKSPGMQSLDGDGSDQHKRAVLLCFNENVRTASDVFRCHNEFIRDTAHASHLQLSAQEWRHFFGNEAANSPYLWGNIGIPVPYTEFNGASHMDAPGRMASEEVCRFRTSWCTKRYEHDHELCGFAHVEVSGGWLRRNPRMHAYKDEMCQAVSMVVDQRAKDHCYVLHECPLGNDCQFAHSMEELMYHPRRYKKTVCSCSGRPGGCPLGEVCSHFHPTETYRFPKKADGRLARHGKHSHPHSTGAKGESSKTHVHVPAPSPILYCKPAPVSSFEEHLVLPGLQNLFRRQCFVVQTHLRKDGACSCCYSNFGDNNGMIDTTKSRLKPPSRGFPTPIVRP